MPGLSMTATAFTTPGIASLLKKRPDILRRVARAHLVSVIRVRNGAKRLSPVDSGRMKTSITERALDDDNLIHVVGTNVRSPKGYPYPRRQEYDTKLHHTTGEWGYLRKPLTAEAKKHADQCLRALVRGLKGYE